MTASPATAKTPFLTVRALSKRFGDFTALNRVDLDVGEGEFVCFLGPSGCGKTTLLRAIAGLDPQNEGAITIAGRDVSHAPPAARDFGIVFQSYALFPNLTVADNVGYGLVNRGDAKPAVRARVAELLGLVGLADQSAKYPVQLSGGQQQRVALARALATSPGLLLLDEPLSALDARVRLRLRDEIKSLQKRLGVTTIMVTHDQEEALSMADRIVVMNHGVVEQVGAPQDIYLRPITAFVADFVGRLTFLQGRMVGEHRVEIGGMSFDCADPGGFAAGTEVEVALRPEAVILGGSDGAGANSFPARIVDVEFLGSFSRVELALDDAEGCSFLADIAAGQIRGLDLSVGATLQVTLPADALRVFPARSEHAPVEHAS
jgi:iron(III) transport system ATP-binding protein